MPVPTSKDKTREAAAAAGRALAGRHALVTGASRGIGRAVAHRLATSGARLSLLARSAEALEAACTETAKTYGVDAVPYPADVMDEAALRSVFEQAERRSGPVDILINNAGNAESAPWDRTTDALWSAMIALNLSAVWHCTRLALPGMVSRGWGRVVTVASTAGLTGYPYVSAYCAAKHGAVGLTRALAREVAASGVTVNAVCPGYTDTDLTQRTAENIAAKTGRSVEAAREAVAAFNPMGRLIAPEEVAEAVHWLCLPASAAVTGQAIAVAGGEVV